MKMRQQFALVLGAALVLGGSSLALVATPAHAVTWTVTDESSLETALLGAGPGDVINVQAGIPTIALSDNLEELDGVTGVTINGNGAVIDGGDSWGGLLISDSTFAVNDLTLRRMSDNNGGNANGLTIEDSLGTLSGVTSNENERSGIFVSASSSGHNLELSGVVANQNGSYGLVGEFEESNLSITGSTFNENQVSGVDATGQDAIFTLSNSTANGNVNEAGFVVETTHGASILAIDASNLTANDNASAGVGFGLTGGAQGRADSITAARNLGNFVVNAENAASMQATNIVSDDAGAIGAALVAAETATVEMDSTTIRGADEVGLLIQRIGRPGGTDTASITVRNSTIDDSRVGILGLVLASGEFELLSSTVSNNNLGGITVVGGDDAFVSLRNSTFASNGDESEAHGNYLGANEPGVVFQLANSTFADTLGQDAGTHVTGPTGWDGVSIQNSIFSGMTNGGADLDLGGSIGSTSSIDSAFVETANAEAQIALTAGSGNIVGQSPDLGPLQDNGGPTLTMLPNDSSPVINAGNDALTALTEDQRGAGFARVSGVQIDMGAVEFQAPDITSESMPGGSVGEEYTFDASGLGEGTLTWAATGLPPGLSIDPATGIISGVPERSGTFEVTFTLTNAAGTDTVTLQLVIEAPPVDPDELAPTGATSIAGFPWLVGGALLLAAAGALTARRARARRRLR